jgi:hypothetical protein
LAVIAIIAVIGLIPLIVAIYRAYSPGLGGSNTPDPTTLPTLLPGQVRMPDMVGSEEGAARLALERMGVDLVVEGEEPHPTWPAFSIIRQSITPGAAVDPGTSVSVVLSQGPALLEVPDVAGLGFEEAEQRLTALDLVVQRYEDWSPEIPGQVVGQDPPPGSLVSNRSLVVLVVSNGSRIPIQANLAGQIGVEAYEIPRLQYQPGEDISLTFFWRAIEPVAEDYSVFVHLTTPQGGIVSQVDATPQNGASPTSNWATGEVIVDPYQLPVPDSTAPGEYQIRIGFYNPLTNTRLPIAEAGRGEQDNLGGLILRSIQVGS